MELMFFNDIYHFPAKSIFFALPYLVLTLISFIALNGRQQNDSKNKSIYICLFLLFLFFFGFRWHIMSDSLAYEQEYLTLKPVFSWHYIDVHSWWWDKGFVVFTMLTKLISDDFRFFVFINALIDISLFVICIRRYSSNYLVTVMAFLAFQGILTEINLFRNIKAILLFLISIRYIENRKWYYFFGINLLGYTFHSSALLFFPMYWILNVKLKLKYVVAVMSVFTIIYLFQINIMENYIYQYMPTDGVMSNKLNAYLGNSTDTVLSIGTFERLLTLCVGLWVYYKTDNPPRLFTIFFNSFLVFYVAYSLFGFNEVFRDRIPYLFIYSYWFLYPYLFSYIVSRKKSMKYVFYALFFLKVYTSTCLCSAYYENILINDVSTRSQRNFLLYKADQ